MGVSANTTHLSSFTKQNFSVQMAYKSTLLSLTFLGPLSPSAVSSSTASLSSQTESTNLLVSSEVLLSWQSLALHDPLVPGDTLCVCVYSFRYHQPLLKRKKSKTLFPLNCGDKDILNSGGQEARASLKPLPSLSQGSLLFPSYFRVAAELISIVSSSEHDFMVNSTVWLCFRIFLYGWVKITKAYLGVSFEFNVIIYAIKERNLCHPPNRG